MAAALNTERPASDQIVTNDVNMDTTPMSNLENMLRESAKRTRTLFTNSYGQAAMDEPAR